MQGTTGRINKKSDDLIKRGVNLIAVSCDTEDRAKKLQKIGIFQNYLLGTDYL
tara:strand:+ start:96 stop:254 length:159 start_codon:yes stop_codon:yes gene_type:complete